MATDSDRERPQDVSNVRIFALAFAGLAVACVVIGSYYAYFEIIRNQSIVELVDSEKTGGPNADYFYVIKASFLFAERYIPLLLISLFALSFTRASVRFVKSSDYSRTSVVPPRDLLIIEEAIKLGKPEPVDQYIRLASLAGGIGLFQKIGLTGLPLTTLSLVVFFALGVLFTENQSDKNKAFLDFTKLTLGAFIGSFVQRQVERRGQESDIQRAVQQAAASVAGAAAPAAASSLTPTVGAVPQEQVGAAPSTPDVASRNVSPSTPSATVASVAPSGSSAGPTTTTSSVPGTMPDAAAPPLQRRGRVRRKSTASLSPGRSDVRAQSCIACRFS
jgi:hypothetical protein